MPCTTRKRSGWHPTLITSSEDGKTLYEVKNLGSHQRKKYGDTGSSDVDIGYRVQCLHEATVHQIEAVVLVVCFGGQEICGYPQTVWR
jgi:hypothetical protein